MIVDEYTLIKRIGKGGFGEVYLGSKIGNLTNYAIKKIELIFFKNKKSKKYMDNDIMIMKDINHPNIIKLLDVKINQQFVFIITEYCNGGNLEDFLEKYLETNNKALPEEIVQNIMRQIIEAFKYLYNKKIMHRYINLRHILINYENESDRENNNIMKGKIRIINFEFARYLKKGELADSVLGVPIYMSPILLNKLNKRLDYKDIKYNEKEDIWSLGTICYELLVGKSPFEANNMNELVNKVNNGEYYIPDNISKEAITFANCMLQYYPKDRLSIDELYNHDFLRKNVKDFNKLDLDINKKYVNNQKIRINIRDNSLIKKILEKQNHELIKLKSNNLDELFWSAFEEFQKYSIPIEPKLIPIKMDIKDKDYELENELNII